MLPTTLPMGADGSTGKIVGYALDIQTDKPLTGVTVAAENTNLAAIMGLLKNSEPNTKQRLSSNRSHSRAGGNPGNINGLLDARFHGHDKSEPLRPIMKGFFNTPFISSAPFKLRLTDASKRKANECP